MSNAEDTGQKRVGALQMGSRKKQSVLFLRPKLI
jgi:hypothetical protein